MIAVGHSSDRGHYEHPIVCAPLDSARLEPDGQRKRLRAFHELMSRRRTVRDFSTESVPLELVELAIATAGTASSRVSGVVLFDIGLISVTKSYNFSACSVTRARGLIQGMQSRCCRRDCVASECRPPPCNSRGAPIPGIATYSRAHRQTRTSWQASKFARTKLSSRGFVFHCRW